jgi:selenocysteine lyase/cysteine desulfurase
MLARLAQLHGVVSIADAAHVPGMLDTSFHDLGVDFIAGSGTKWQCGPAGTGLLYVRNKVLNEHNPQPLPVFWPVVSVWYPLEGGLPPRTTTRVPSYDIAEYLQASGSASQARMMGLQRACEIWDRIGRGRIERHLLDLSAHLKELIVDRWGESSVYSPRTDARLCSAITTFTPFRPSDRHDASRCATFVSRLRDEYGVVIRDVTFAVAGSPAPHCALRIAARLFHERSDNDRLVRAMAALSDDMA